MQAVRFGLAVAAIGVITAIDFRLHVNPTTVALTFLVAVLLVSAYWGLRYAVVLAVGATAAFNFYFLPPIGTFNGSAKLGRTLCFPDNRTCGQQSGGTRTA
jgi:K+-sensing histidine kinase KdpD